MNYRKSNPLNAERRQTDRREPQSIRDYVFSQRCFAPPLRNSALKSTTGNSALYLITYIKQLCPYNSNYGFSLII